MLDLSEVDVPDFDSDELERFLIEVKRRGAHIRRLGRQRVLGATSLVLAACVVIAAVALSGGAAPVRRATTPRPAPPSWRLVSDISAGWRVLPTAAGSGPHMVCPSADTCYAVGWPPSGEAVVSAIDVTHDGAESWTTSRLPVTLTSLSDLSCSSGESCALLGVDASGDSYFVTTNDGGNTWQTVPGPASLHSTMGVMSLGCVTSTSCVAISSDGASPETTYAYTTADGGQTWQTSPVSSDFVPEALRCFGGTGDCVATGFVPSSDPNGSPSGAALVSSDGGADWSLARTPSGLGPLTSLGCGGGSCLAGFFGNDGSATVLLTSSDEGATWTEVTSDSLPPALVTEISCPAPGVCWEGGASRAEGATDGHGQIVVTYGALVAGALSGEAATTSDAGQSWQASPLPDGLAAVTSISCPTSNSCYALALQQTSSSKTFSLVVLAYG